MVCPWAAPGARICRISMSSVPCRMSVCVRFFPMMAKAYCTPAEALPERRLVSIYVGVREKFGRFLTSGVRLRLRRGWHIASAIPADHRFTLDDFGAKWAFPALARFQP